MTPDKIRSIFTLLRAANPYHRVWEMLRDPAGARANVEVETR